MAAYVENEQVLREEKACDGEQAAGEQCGHEPMKAAAKRLHAPVACGEVRHEAVWWKGGQAVFVGEQQPFADGKETTGEAC